MSKKTRIAIAVGLVLVGLSLIWAGLDYSLSHFDTGVQEGDSLFVIHADKIGYMLIVLAPIILKRYIWSVILIGLAAIFWAWVYFSIL